MLEIAYTILKRKKYAIIAIITFSVMIAISYYLTVINVSHKSIYYYAEMNDYIYTIVTLMLGFIISILSGLYAALLSFRIDIKSNFPKKDKVAGSIGVGIGIVASGCPSCGVPLLGIVGFPLGLSYLPFRGIELKLLSIFLILISIHYITLNIEKSLRCSLK